MAQVDEKGALQTSPTSTQATQDKEQGVNAEVASVSGESGVHIHINASGHKDELQRHFGLLSICGAALSIDSAWIAYAGSIQVAIANGGPTGIIWELLLACFYYFFINASIAELASSIPSSGGVYHWATASAGKYGRIVGWFAAYLNFFGWIFDLASIAYIPANVSVEMYLIFHPDLVTQPWMTYLAFIIIVTLATIIVIFANWILPTLQHIGMFFVLVGGVVSIICVAALASPHASASEVFGTFVNTTGWPNGWAFLLGVLNGAFTIGTPDAITHLAEEMPYPRRDLPKAVFAQIILGTLYAWCFAVATFFGVSDLDQVLSTPGSFVLGSIYLQATGTKGGAFGLLFIVLIAILICTISTVLTCSRIWWSLARDNVVPLPRLFGYVNTRLSCPIPATLFCYVLTLGFGAIQLGSATAFSDLVGSFIILTSTSYLLAILPHLLSGRSNIPRGDFWMGKYGYVVNALACIFIIFFDVVFCFPYALPTSGSTMNYNSVILVGVALIAAFWWLVYGWRNYTGPHLPHLDAAGHTISEKD